MIDYTTGIQAGTQTTEPKPALPERTDGRDTTGFEAAAPGGEERFSGSTLLVEAYAAIWLIMMAWILLLWRKQASLTARLDGLEAALDRAEKRVATPDKGTSAKDKSPKEKGSSESAARGSES
jgi:hypothetical protein